MQALKNMSPRAAVMAALLIGLVLGGAATYGAVAVTHPDLQLAPRCGACF